MAEEIVGIKIQVGGQEKILTSMGEIRKEMKAAQFDVLKFTEAFGASSKEAVEAAKRVAQLGDAIGDAKSLTDAFNPDAKFKAFSAALSGVAGGFAAVQGAMALFGSESTNVQKALLKVQAAMALSQGLQTVGESIDKFKELGSVISNSTTLQKANSMATAAAAAVQRAFTGAVNETATGFKVLKGAIAATGIGLILVALGTIVAYWDDIKESINGVSSEQKKLNVDVEKNLKAEQSKLDKLDNQTNQLKQQGKSEKEILQIKIKQTDEAISAAKISLTAAKATRDTQIAAAKRNQDILIGIMNFLATPVRTLLGVIDNVGAALGKQFNLLKAYDATNKSLTTYLFDPKETADKGKESVEAAEKILNTLEEKRAGYLEDIKKLNKNANKGDDKDAKEKEAAELEAQKRLLKIKNDTEVAGIEDQYKSRKLAIDKATEEEIRDINKNEKLKQETKDALVKALNDKAVADKAKIDREQKEEQKKKDDEERKKLQEDDRKFRELTLQQRIEEIDKEIAKKDQDFEDDKQRFADKMALLNEQKLIELENLELTNSQRLEIEKKYSDAKKKILEDETAAEQKAHDARLALQVSLLDTATSVIGGLGALFDQGSAASKTLALTDIAIGTAKGFVQGLDIAQKGAQASGPAAPFAFPIFYATQIAAVLNAVAKAKGVLATTKGGASGGGSVSAPTALAAAPIAPAAPIQNTVTQLSPNSINQLGSATNRAYVVESDVTNSQDRIKRINRAARLT
ncbi:hypothetical protein UFOVP617_51 [uncultured Caudovirales phage]|uniref:Uncharacterized protein n=1 Tax=uncultured Caudovirales phage TaxID=2100421 RepID=A0A6J5N7N6_9CAUD|nr:hypothetical protein UFOVP617_51 [uncultured Caudovirales phage]